MKQEKITMKEWAKAIAKIAGLTAVLYAGALLEVTCITQFDRWHHSYLNKRETEQYQRDHPTSQPSYQINYNGERK